MTLHAAVYFTIILHIAKIEDCMFMIRDLTFFIDDARENVLYVWFFILPSLPVQNIFLIHIILTLIIYFLRGKKGDMA